MCEITQGRTFTYFLFKVIHSLAFLSKPSGLLEKRECISLNHRTLTLGTSLLSLASTTCLCLPPKATLDVCSHSSTSDWPRILSHSWNHSPHSTRLSSPIRADLGHRAKTPSSPFHLGYGIAIPGSLLLLWRPLWFNLIKPGDGGSWSLCMFDLMQSLAGMGLKCKHQWMKLLRYY